MAVPTGVLERQTFPAERDGSLPGGYMGRLLRVDLSSGRITTDALPGNDVLRKLWGGQALGSYLLMKELRLDAKPFDADVPIFMMTGPVAGTGLTPGGTKMCSVYLSPATGYTLGRAATSGFWAMALRAAGYDGIVITGRSDRPVYLYVDQASVELRDAAAVWGKGTRETEDMLRLASGHQDARVACIGPAGEHLVHAAMLVNDYNHVASHGVGAVMGSKKLKAIVTRGSLHPPIHDKERLVQAGSRWRKALAPMTFKVEARYGVGHGKSWGAITKHNWRATEITEDDARGLDQNKITPRPCYQCPRLCPWDAVIGEGPHKGMVVHFDAGSEWLDTFYNLDLKGNDVLYLAERINDLGIECSHFADGAGLAFEAWEKGLLGPDRTDGLELKWGDAAAVETLLDRCSRREGWLGNMMADGPKELAEALGGDAPNWVVHTKGGTPAQHEWRPLLGNMLRELVASGGMKPQGGGSEEPAPDLTYREKWGPLSKTEPDGWAWSHILSEQYRQFSGLMGACWFAMAAQRPDGLNCMVDALNATTGWDVSMDEALTAGHRAMILQSIFGTQRGWTAQDDWQNLGPRFVEPIPDGQYKGFTIAKWMPSIIHEYYRLSGRHETSGRPFNTTLAQLGLDEFSQWSEPE